LRNFDLDTISKVIYHTARGLKEIDIEDLIEGIDKYSTIEDEKNLRKFLYSVIYEKNMQKGVSLMLSEALLPSRIRFLGQCENWEVAIKEASLPLLEQGAIEQEYVDAMIDSVHKNGPYIVLDDFFALAHARPNEGVNELSMSLLKINNSVDLLGKEVKVIVVLAATDNKAHLKALASLTELLMDKGNLDRIIKADKIDTVIKLIEKYS
jgi:mannitol/fructose-specific phosphotransferase system IIA component (Ntr-type)